MKERLIQFISYLGIGRNKFETEVGISQGYVTKMTDSIGSKILLKIFTKYPELNEDWLLHGTEPMLKERTYPSKEEAKAAEGETEAIVQTVGCALCKEKDKRIETLEMLVQTQKDLIEQLRKTTPEMGVCLKRG